MTKKKADQQSVILRRKYLIDICTTSIFGFRQHIAAVGAVRASCFCRRSVAFEVIDKIRCAAATAAADRTEARRLLNHCWSFIVRRFDAAFLINDSTDELRIIRRHRRRCMARLTTLKHHQPSDNDLRPGLEKNQVFKKNFFQVFWFQASLRTGRTPVGLLQSRLFLVYNTIIKICNARSGRLSQI